MNRENRYLVLKLSDIDKHLSDVEKDKLSAISSSITDGRSIDNKPDLKCVVVEHDWPEYEPTWEAIEKRVKNETSALQRVLRD